MRTIGDLISQARKKHKISLGKLSQKTKIKPRYINAIEKEEWHIIPNFAIAQGFVRNIAVAIGIDPETAVALLRRDFEEQDKHAVSQSHRVFWTPKTTIYFTSLIFGGLLIFYLVRQYLTFVAPPPLNVNITRSGESIEISGKTNKEASVIVNGETILITDDGTFKINITARSGDLLKIEALSRSGKATKKEIVAP